MNPERRNTIIAGILIITGMIAGFLSVAPAVDSSGYLSLAAESPTQVIRGAIFQFIICISYLGFALCLYPIIKKQNKELALGFLSFRIIASTLILAGTIILLSILVLSQEYVRLLPREPAHFETFGFLLKEARDLINHVFMILVLCLASMLFYILMIKSKLIPLWLSIWGLGGVLLSALASILILFGKVEIITSVYIILNIPTALIDIILAIWLIIKGFNKTS